MLLDTRTAYLTLHDRPVEPGHQAGRRLAIVPDLAAAVEGWTAGSRVSPIWPIERADCSPDFIGRQKLFFVGPVRPGALAGAMPELLDSGLWMTAGMFNMLVRVPARSASAARLRRWARANSVPYEEWSLSDGDARSEGSHVLWQGGRCDAAADLAAEAAKIDAPMLRSALQENVVATATSLARARALRPSLHRKLATVANATRLTLVAYREDRISELDLQSRLLSLNAALSRFSSQAFSGIPPILSTECHFWIHSLLGTGSANLALDNIVSSIQAVLGEARLPERLAELATVTADVPDLDALTSGENLLSFDLMKASREPADGGGIVPLVTYFSGRDGFSSQVQTLSAPLTTIAECTSYRSNLLTITHEVSHIFVQATLAMLSPSAGNEPEMQRARAMLSRDYRASNLLDAARQLFLEALVSMHTAAFGGVSDEAVAAKLPSIVEIWRTELQEILVHAFDFMYFHQSDPEHYVTSIWQSWCAIPGIADRVPEYMMRTLCAVSANLLGESPATRFEAALKATVVLLQKVNRLVGKDSYVKLALDHAAAADTDPTLRERMQKEYAARLLLVRLVKIFLFSETVAAALFADPHVRSSASATDKKKLNYDVIPIGNALTFLKEQLETNPSEAASLWTLHCLAFDLEPGRSR